MSTALSASVLAAASPAAPATGVFGWTWALVALPLLGAAVLLLTGRRARSWAPIAGSLVVLADFALALVLFAGLLSRPGTNRAVDQHVYTWLAAGPFHVAVGFLLDPLSIVFVLLITGVGGLIHLYSIGYLEHDPDRARFFGELNLFVAAMLLLVLADNFLTLYVGWEGVGLASYLLIGFWYDRPSAATAAKKAFVVNRVGDVGLSLAVMLMFATFGTTSFAGVFAGAGSAGGATATALGLLLLLGACGKSAQVPLQSWLLDAMEGPTPVSALIHAATMVTAGVYLIARANPIFNASPDARLAVTVVGLVTLLVGAVIGCAYDDIKKVLASSTMSQIGYMMLAAGLGPAGYAIAIMHLLAHGFFKANMFLGAGSVMHAMDNEVDMRKYGGLARVMPVTAVTFTAGYLAIIGFPGFSGFFTKDKIIEAAFDAGGVSGWVLGLGALLGVGLTAFYMTRLMAMTFLGQRRWEPDVHPHESPAVMTVPMMVLAVGSAVAGGLFVLGGSLQRFLAPVVGRSAEIGVHTISPTVLTLISLLVMVGGASAAWWVFGRRPVPRLAPQQVSLVTVAARRQLFGDAINEAMFMRPGQYLTRSLVFFDNKNVDGVVRGLAALIGGTSGRLRRVQTGFVRSYALLMFGGAVLVVLGLALLGVA